MKSLTIIIPHVNQDALLDKCLQSLGQQTLLPSQVVVVDNGSTDQTFDVVDSYRDTLNLEVIPLGRNTGFAYAVNRGIELALQNKSEYIMLLNNDTTLADDCLRSLVQSFDYLPDHVAVVQPLILNDAYHNLVDSAGIAITRDMSAINYLQGKPYVAKEQGCVEIFGATGCAAIFTAGSLREVHQKTGEYFDEQYFAYYEDVDMAWRLRYLGYSAWCNHDACIYHAHSATGKSYSPFKSFYVHRNHLFNVIKNSPTHLTVEVLGRMVVRYFLLASSVLRRKGPSYRLYKGTGGGSMVKIVVRAWLQVTQSFVVMMSKRSRIKRACTVSLQEQSGWLDRFGTTISSTVYSERPGN